MESGSAEAIEDIIPEPLIIHILSYPPTKDAVQTSVLSKAWVNRWTLINKLEFDDSLFYSPERKQHFINFVYRVLHIIKCSSVESFSLVIANKYTWISKMLLWWFPSSHGRFRCLKFLKLCGVSFIYNSPMHYRNLFLHSLQKFEARNCSWLGAKGVNIQAPLLENVLTQQRVPSLPVFAMLTHLKLGQVSCEFLLGLLQNSPVLKTLVFKGIWIFDKELLNSSVVPGCFASTLQVAKFEKVNGSEHELYLAQYFLENGMVLERISFSLVGSWLAKSKVMEEFKEKLFSFEKGFSFAIVEFSYE